MSALSVRNSTRRSTPGVPFEKILKQVLPGWEISLAFIGATRSRHLNQVLRRKNYTPNVLSLPVGNRSGEIFICRVIAKKEAPRYGMSERTYLLFLFIHALLHLKGVPHGTTMEHTERLLLRRFARGGALYTHGPTHRSRHRYRNFPG